MPRDIFHPLSDLEREERLRAFGEFLKARDGAPDLAKRTLSGREEQLQRFQDAQALYPGVVNRALFEAQYRRFDKRVPTPKEMLLLLTFVKFNNTEAYTVEKSFIALEQGLVTPKSELEIFVLLEEHYHTKILLSAAHLFGLKVEPHFEAAATVKILNIATLRLPDFFRYPLVLVAEFLGVVMMSRMLRSVREIFQTTPPLRDDLEERLIEVLIDEIGHVSYNRLQLDSRGLALARALLPAVALGIGRPVEEAEVLGLFPIPWKAVFTFEMRHLPAEIRRCASIA